MSETEHLLKAKERYDRYLTKRYGQPVGVALQEIQRMEIRLGFKFPDAYKEYLLWMGEHRSGPFAGSDFFFTDLPSYQTWLKGLFEENATPVPDNFFCFYSHQGYIVYWFDRSSSDSDPHCWGAGETSDGFDVKPIGKFSRLVLGGVGVD
ncbi:MAG: SMI1/KNR4 family protein [Pseudomonadota bacterium]